MNIHEYQAKEIVKGYGVRIQEGVVIDNVSDVVEAAESLKAQTGTGWFVVKAQIHAGGRGKGGGVKLAKNLDELKERVSQILACN
jgi:succinyl-CoA synthetase beta subunit